jgi:hypothetical protein
MSRRRDQSTQCHTQITTNTAQGAHSALCRLPVRDAHVHGILDRKRAQALVRRFMLAFVHGEMFDNPTTDEKMMEPWNAFPFTLNPAATSLAWPIEYGYGMMCFHMPRIFTPFQPIPEVVGHTGIAGSWLCYSPPAGLFLSGTVSKFTASALPFRFLPRLLGALAST